MGKAIKNEVIIENGSKRNIVIESIVAFDKLSEVEIRKKFNDAIMAGKLLKCQYTDKTWVVVSRFKDQYLYIYFDNLNHDFNLKLKAFTVLMLEKYETHTTAAYSNFICKILKVTNNLTDQSVDTIGYLKEKIKDRSQVSCFEDFIKFVGISKYQARIFINALKSNIAEHSTRVLPCFQSVLLMDQIIEYFYQNDLKDFIRFYPIVLWWKMTMAIPMRPIEFFTLKADSFYEKQGNFYVHIERALKSDPNEKNKHNIELVKDFRITKDLYNIFREYISGVNIGSEGFIFNTDEHKIIKRPREYVGVNLCDNLLESFYLEIIAYLYDYTIIGKGLKQVLDDHEIERMTLGDTRHLSFLNLIISGYNPYTIAQIGGHRELASQMLYYSGATSFCTSKAYAFALGLGDLNVNAVPIKRWRKNQIMLHSTDLTKAIEIDGGYCTCTNFPYECYSSSCRSGKCQYFIYRNIEQMDKEIKDSEESIARSVELLRLMIYNEPEDSTERAEIIGDLTDKITALGRLYRNKMNIEGKR